MRYFHFPVHDIDPVDVFASFEQEPYALLFDSSDPDHPLSHCSYICAFPVEKIESVDEKVTITNKDRQFVVHDNPFDVLKQRLEHWAPDENAFSQINGVHRFVGGAAGYFGYDLGRTLEQLPVRAKRQNTIPDMAMGIYTSVMAFNHGSGKAILYILAKSESDAEAQAGKIFKKLRERQSGANDNVTSADLMPEKKAEEFKSDIRKVIDYIYAGDIFQANLSMQFAAKRPEGFNSFAHYQKLRSLNKAPFSAFLNYNDFQIASVSPESFLSCHKGDVITRPIKGTCPRESDEAANKQAIAALQADEKCRAENAMIVDLLRNDLSRVCTDFSIDVPSLCEIESYARVNHMVSTIKGELRPDHHVIDLVKACFPGGSITGAPKIRAMEIIEELEPVRRGPYCGAIGFIGFDQSLETNIAIRTIVHQQDTITMNVGGGIVTDSNPESEYAEIMAKAKGLLQSFEISDFDEDEQREEKRA